MTTPLPVISEVSPGRALRTYAHSGVISCDFTPECVMACAITGQMSHDSRSETLYEDEMPQQRACSWGAGRGT